jgi:hypothetical protein
MAEIRLILLRNRRKGLVEAMALLELPRDQFVRSITFSKLRVLVGRTCNWRSPENPNQISSETIRAVRML